MLIVCELVNIRLSLVSKNIHNLKHLPLTPALKVLTVLSFKCRPPLCLFAKFVRKLLANFLALPVLTESAPLSAPSYIRRYQVALTVSVFPLTKTKLVIMELRMPRQNLWI